MADIIGTSAGETLAGTIAVDTIRGSGGNDILYGDSAGTLSGKAIAGGDLLVGDDPDLGAGNDSLVGDARQLMGTAQGGIDILHGNAGNDQIYGDALTSLGAASIGGDDTIYGGAGSDYVKGDAQNLRGSSRGGNDIIDVGDGGDHVYGDAWGVYDTSRGGDDIVYGGAGSDYVYGDALKYFGPGFVGGHDVIYGGDGNDSLSGGRGDDTLTGGAGRDLFKMINHGDGEDTYLDFTVGEDRVTLEGYGLTFQTLDTDANGVVGVGDTGVTVTDGNLHIDMTRLDTTAGVPGPTGFLVLGIVSMAPADFDIRPYLDWQP